MNRKNTLRYRFSDKHKEYLRRTVDHHYNVAEGSIRSGKSTDNVLAFAQDIKHSRDKVYLATASTQPTAKLIIGDCDGFGLEHIFRGQCRWGKYKGNECLMIQGEATRGRLKIVLFCGGAKADSYKKFRGMTIGAWIATEIDLHHEETIREGLKRLVKSDANKIYWDLNPGNPSAPIYREYIDAWAEMHREGKLIGGYNYMHFTLFDNVNLSKQNIEQTLARYPDKTSVWYRRDIEGKRVAAEGLIYRYFADHVDEYLIDRDQLPHLRWINGGQDFGGNKSHHTFCAIGIDDRMHTLYVLAAESHDAAGSTTADIIAHLNAFFGGIRERYGYVDRVRADCADPVMINTEAINTEWRVCGSVKNAISDRIRATAYLMEHHRLKIVRGACDDLVEAFCNAVWDPKKHDDERLDNFTYNVCILDAFEYAFEEYINALIPDLAREEINEYE